ncbi:MAG TPA: DUF1610 domain-containing protein [Candidatus Altiarchaeales archaeon]|nr:DUF1610 domain-containing protein [Candidatus Altiarchaeales archaeon]
MDTKNRCTSCGVEVGPGHTEFDCPKCGKYHIIRCSSCRVLGTLYLCEKCGFEGP